MRTPPPRVILYTVLAAHVLTFRRLDPDRDGDLAFARHRAAHVASFGNAVHCRSKSHYLRWVRAKVEEYPDGYVLATLGGRVAGQLELEIPYGKAVGYVNLFYVSPEFRRLGLGRRMHGEYLEPFFRSWEARHIELHVSTTNGAASAFYRSLGYHRVTGEPPSGGRMRLMTKAL